MKLLGLKTVRKTFGFTMRDLAKKLDVSANAINIWENGGGEISENRIEELSLFFDIEKEILLKEKHNAKDLMLIELARSRYKLEEYRLMIIEDKDSVDNVINIAWEEFAKESNDTMWRTLEGQGNYESLKSLLTEIIKLYSNIFYDDYDECDDVFRLMIEEISNETEEWEYFRVLWFTMFPSENMWENDEDNIIYCDKADILEQNIRDNVKQLYKLYLYETGKYKPKE